MTGSLDLRVGGKSVGCHSLHPRVGNAERAKVAGIGHVSSHTFRHTHRTWLDSVGTPVGVKQKLMRQSDIRTTMNIYGDAATDDMRKAI